MLFLIRATDILCRDFVSDTRFPRETFTRTHLPFIKVRSTIESIIFLVYLLKMPSLILNADLFPALRIDFFYIKTLFEALIIFK